METGYFNPAHWRARQSRIAHLFFSHAGHVPLALVILEALLAEPGYFARMDAYLLLTAGLLQAGVGERFASASLKGRVLANFVGPLVYSLVEFSVEGFDFIAQWHHQAYWGYALVFAVLQGVPSRCKGCQGVALFGESIVRASIPLVTYALFEAKSGGQSLALGTFWADTAHQYLTIVLLLLGALMGFVEVNLHRAQAQVKALTEKLRVYSSWALGKNLLEKALEDAHTLSLKRVNRAVLFVDIRGFTAWSERRSPEEVVQMLNVFYEESEKALATLPIKLKYTADEILAVFETCAQALSAVEALLPQLQKTLCPLGLSAGAGLHYGSVVEGVMGGAHSKAYDFIGDTVNTAQRLCSAAQAWELLLSDAAAQECGITPQNTRSIQAKGRAAELAVTAIRY
ncbi:MAG: adenylate/guanylate cyclase domain-containing protein [Rhodoferax sp.]|nr:MAG: adenylate/guanylate cyclase domain-containing protein [Rhodoferax sp.]